MAIGNFFGGQFFGGGFFGAIKSVDPGDKPPSGARRKSPHRGFDIEEWRREKGALDESLAQTIERTWASLTGADEPAESVAEAERIVAPFVSTPMLRPTVRAVDWRALAKELSAVAAIAQAQSRAEALRAAKAAQLEADDEVITLLILNG